MTSPAAKRQKIQVQLKENQDGLQKEMRQRETKVEELRQAVDYHKCSAKAAVEHSVQMFTELISSMKKRRAEITKMIRAQEKAEVSRVEEVILALEQEISDLRKRHEELGQLSLIEDDIYVIQNFSSLSHYQCSDLCNTSVSQLLTFEEIEEVIGELKSQLDDLCEQDIVRISEKVPTVHVMVNSVNNKIEKYLPSQPKTREEFLMYFVDLNLNTPVYSTLSLKNNKSVLKRNNDYTSYGDTLQVLCKEKLSGRCYFEVQWEDMQTHTHILKSKQLQDPPSQISLSTEKTLRLLSVETLCLAVFYSSNAQAKVESASSTCPLCGLVIYHPKRKANDPFKALDNAKKTYWFISVLIAVLL
ncbi:hypothetical protein QQF64_005506 [Cirrhinus molitorella]|uniref:TRIM8/14/16/25/29/45/65 coiled-coil region domain-containing protein n=1 Tax=Cirrhinus molitorella TaxID=172907 RepID=A0ABR3MFS2_9TELE